MESMIVFGSTTFCLHKRRPLTFTYVMNNSLNLNFNVGKDWPTMDPFNLGALEEQKSKRLMLESSKNSKKLF